MDKRNHTDYAILSLVILVNLSFLATLLKVEFFTSFSFYCSFFVLFWVFFRRLYATKKLYWQWLLLVTFMLLSVIVSGIQSNFDYYKRFIITLMVFVCFELAPVVHISEKSKKDFIGIFACSGLICEYMFYFGDLKNTFYGSTISLSLNFSNPNEAALWLCGLFVLLLFSNRTFSNWKARLPILVIAVLLIPIIWATQSRNVMIVAVFAVAWYLLMGLIKNWLPKWLIICFVLLPVAVFFAYMYVYIPHQDFFAEIFSFLDMGAHKSLGSRFTLWSYVQQDLGHCFLLGDYGMYHDEQMHNSLMTQYCMYGGPCAFLMCLLMIRSLNKIKVFHSVNASAALCILLITGCFEASIFVGVAGAYLFVLLIPILCSRQTATQ